jgi:hypothetical protein
MLAQRLTKAWTSRSSDLDRFGSYGEKESPNTLRLFAWANRKMKLPLMETGKK